MPRGKFIAACAFFNDFSNISRGMRTTVLRRNKDFVVTYLSLVDEADDSPFEFFGEFPAIKKDTKWLN